MVDAPSRLGDLRRDARFRLERAGIADAAFDARLLLAHATGASQRDVLLDADRAVPLGQVEALERALERRVAGEPVHRIIGEREFHGLRLGLSRQTLEPRPDTEALVDLVLPFIRARSDDRGRCDILDLGTGTGAVALALLAAEKRAFATGTDISAGALERAASNAVLNGLQDRFATRLSDWFEELSGGFDAIVSNPPYIESNAIAALSPEVRDHDPRAALDGGQDGLDAYRVIAAGAGPFLKPDGVVGVEIGHDQRASVTILFEAEGFRLLDEAKDLGGRDRALLFALQ